MNNTAVTTHTKVILNYTHTKKKKSYYGITKMASLAKNSTNTFYRHTPCKSFFLLIVKEKPSDFNQTPYGANSRESRQTTTHPVEHC